MFVLQICGSYFFDGVLLYKSIYEIIFSADESFRRLFMNKLLPLILISSLSLLATSCGSFFSSSILKQEIEAKIEYENSPSMTIRIMSDDGITSPSGDLIQKATDRIPVSFVPYTGLQFIKWQIINRENGNAYTDKDAAEIIDFENPNLTDTSFKIKRWATIFI